MVPNYGRDWPNLSLAEDCFLAKLGIIIVEIGPIAALAEVTVEIGPICLCSVEIGEVGNDNVPPYVGSPPRVCCGH